MPIVKILPTDVISESRDKINKNFDLISGELNKTTSIIKKYKDDLNQSIETTLEIESDKIESSIKKIKNDIDNIVEDKMISAIIQTDDRVSTIVREEILDAENRLNEKISSIRVDVDNITSSISGIEGNIPDVNRLIDELREDLQNQIDGNIETYYMSGVPSLTNSPAIDWVEGVSDESKKDKIYEKHQGDLYYNKDNNCAYRFLKNGNDWIWKLVTDTDLTNVLDRIGALESAADGNVTIYNDTPTVPYNVGDLWFQDGELKICIHSRTSGDYNPDDWDYTSKYDPNFEALKSATDGKVTKFYGMNPLPINYKRGDIWYDVTWPVNSNLADNDNRYYHDTLVCKVNYENMFDIEHWGPIGSENTPFSRISQTIDTIELEVFGGDSDGNSLRSLITQTKDEINSTVEGLREDVNGELTSVRSSIDQKVTMSDVNNAITEVRTSITNEIQNEGDSIRSMFDSYALIDDVEGLREAVNELSAVVGDSDIDIESALSQYAKKTDVESIAGATIENVLEGKDYVVSSSLDTYAKKTDIPDVGEIEEALAKLKAEIESEDSDGDYENILAELELRVKKEELIDLEGRVTTNESAIANLTTSVGDINTGLSSYAKKTEITNLEDELGQRIEEAKTEIYATITGEDSDSDIENVRAAVSVLAERVNGLDSAQSVLSASIDDNTASIAAMAFKDEDGNVTTRLNFGADKITIDTDNFSLDEDGNVEVNGVIYATELHIGGKTATSLDELKGEKGEKGDAGADGKNGETPEIRNGVWYIFDKSVNDYIPIGPARGEKGDKGDKGDAGSAGKDGITPEIRKKEVTIVETDYLDEEYVDELGDKMYFTYDGTTYATLYDYSFGQFYFVLDGEYPNGHIVDESESSIGTGHITSTENLDFWYMDNVCIGRASGENGTGSTYDDTWLTKAFDETEISGGLIMSGNVLVGDDDGNLTAGMSGANVSGVDDVRFFAGTSDVNLQTGTMENISEAMQTASFRVYESGKMVAADAEIFGNVLVKDFNSKITAGIIGKSNVEDAVQRMYVKGFITDGKLAFVVADADIFDSIDTDGENWWENNGEHGIDGAYVEVYYTNGISTEKSDETDEYGYYNFGSYNQSLYYFIIKVSKSGYKTYNAIGSIYGGVVLLTEYQETKNDVRFFAGTSSNSSSLKSDVDNAPFRVYEDGTLYSRKANIGGSKTVSGYDYNTTINADEVSVVAKSVSGSVESSIKIEVVDLNDPNIPSEVRNQWGTSGAPVPQLVLTYMGEKYYLDPSMWIKRVTTPDWSNTHFFKEGGNEVLNSDYRIFNSLSDLTTLLNNAITNSNGVNSNSVDRYFINSDGVSYSYGITDRESKFMYEGFTGYGESGTSKWTVNYLESNPTKYNYIGTFNKYDTLVMDDSDWNFVKNAFAGYPSNGYVKPGYSCETLYVRDILTEMDPDVNDLSADDIGEDNVHALGFGGEIILNIKRPVCAGFYTSTTQNSEGYYPIVYDRYTSTDYSTYGYSSGILNPCEMIDLVPTNSTVRDFLGLNTSGKSLKKGREFVCLNYPIYKTERGSILTSNYKTLYVMVVAQDNNYDGGTWTYTGINYYRVYRIAYVVADAFDDFISAQSVFSQLINKINNNNCIEETFRSNVNPGKLFSIYQY